MKKLFLFFFISFFAKTYAQDSLKTLQAIRIISAPKIDGILDDGVWKDVPIATDFIQDEPDYQQPSTQKTEVKISYDNTAIYVGAFMYDNHPDSILHELGNRDDEDLNADYFMVGFDTYNKLIDAYIFGVSASGIQLDNRFQEENFDAVWQSAVKINDKGWCAEFKIPYSAIRFPDSKEQHWRAEFQRVIRRRRETSRWTFVPRDQQAIVKYFGKLEGISDIIPPLRLSLTPYLSTYYETAPVYNSDGTYNYANSFSYNAGADIKYGLDERFTLDMTLLPDFGQVQSDNKVKNLSYQEITYEDNRPFFKEGTELFNRGMFYTRRIGKIPSLYYSVPDLLNAGESIEKNPSQTKLLNATKISGRGNGGMGFGLVNAVTDNTYAVVKDSIGNTRKILTEPFTNYNAFVFDQQLKNSSKAYLINTNVMRNGSAYRDANVTSTGFSLQNKSNTYEVNGGTTLSQIFMRNDSLTDTFTDQMGYSYFVSAGKISGTWQYGVGHEALSSTFDRNDMGYLGTNNFATSNVRMSYNRFKPWKSIQRSFTSINLYYSENYTSGRRTNLSSNLNSFILFKSYLATFFGGGFSPVSSYDYNEPRAAGRYFRSNEYYYAYGGFSSNYQKMLALDVTLNTSNWLKNNIHNFEQGQGYSFEIKPRFRASDKLSFYYEFNYSFDPFNIGGFDGNSDSLGNVIFGGKKLDTYVNTLTAKYIFKNDLSLSLNTRHYWITGEYLKYYTLLDNGLLADNPGYTVNNDFSYNAFTIDAVFSWQFSPGSVFSIVYKNAIETAGDIIPKSFDNNFSSTIESPQTNSISLKVLYYLDYQSLKKRGS